MKHLSKFKKYILLFVLTIPVIIILWMESRSQSNNAFEDFERDHL